MAQSLTLAPAGLWTNPNPLSAAPEGAMTEALNVVISRPGVIEPRPPIRAQTSFTALLVDEDIVKMIPFEDDLLVLTKDANTGTGHAYWYSANDDITQTGDLANGTAWGLTAGQIHGAALRGNLYVTCAEGVFRCTTPGDDTAARAGLPRPGPPIAKIQTTGYVNYPLAANTAAAYRAVYVETAGDIEIRSAPSSRVLERNYTAGASKAIELTYPVTLPADVEMYRSSTPALSYDAEPTDEMVMVGSIDSTGGMYGDDAGSTGLLGASLYTNATQQGALLENGITPICRDITTFRGMVFFGGAKWAHSLTFDVLGYGTDWRGTNLSTTDRLTSLTITGDTTNTSTTVSNVSAADIADVRVGQRVYLNSSTPEIADANFPIATYVTAVGATSFTINNAATATTVGATIRLSDWIEVSIVDGDGTTTKRVWLGSTDTPLASTAYVYANEFSADVNAFVQGPQDMAFKLSQLFSGKATVSAFGDGSTLAWSFLVEAWRYDTSSLTVKCSNPDAVSMRIDSTTGKSGTVRGGVATLAWSKPLEPEHVPPGYAVEIGAADKAIERVVAARDSLFVFKEDGVWRVSGYSPDTLQVDEYDRTMRLAHPDAACEWGGRVAAWTNKGVVLVGDNGTEEIGMPIGDLMRDAFDSLVDSSCQGVFMVGWPDRGLLLLGLPADNNDDYAQYVYCWSEATRAWTRWDHAEQISTAAILNNTLYFGTKSPNDGATKAKVLQALPYYGNSDASYTVTVSTVSGTSVTIAAGSGWTPTIGDSIATTYFITDVTDSTHFTVNTTGLTTGSKSVGHTRAATVTFTVRDGENAGAQKLFRESTLLFGSQYGATALAMTYETDRSHNAASEVLLTTPDSTSTDPTTIRTRIPREVRRCGRLTQQIQIGGHSREWELHGVSYVFEPLATRFRDAS